MGVVALLVIVEECDNTVPTKQGGLVFELQLHSGPYGSLSPGIILRVTPASSMIARRITPPEEPSRAMA